MTDSFYNFLENLRVNDDGSFNYDITNRILRKYTKKNKANRSQKRDIGLIISDKREAA